MEFPEKVRKYDLLKTTTYKRNIKNVKITICFIVLKSVYETTRFLEREKEREREKEGEREREKEKKELTLCYVCTLISNLI